MWQPRASCTQQGALCPEHADFALSHASTQALRVPMIAASSRLHFSQESKHNIEHSTAQLYDISKLMRLIQGRGLALQVWLSSIFRICCPPYPSPIFHILCKCSRVVGSSVCSLCTIYSYPCLFSCSYLYLRVCIFRISLSLVPYLLGV